MCLVFHSTHSNSIWTERRQQDNAYSKSNQEIVQKSQKKLLINRRSNFLCCYSLKIHFKIYTGINLKKFEMHSLNQIIYEKIYTILILKTLFWGRKLEKNHKTNMNYKEH